jgi:hypothetical protein
VKRGCEGMFPMDVPKNTRFAIKEWLRRRWGSIWRYALFGQLVFLSCRLRYWLLF